MKLIIAFVFSEWGDGLSYEEISGGDVVAKENGVIWKSSAGMQMEGRMKINGYDEVECMYGMVNDISGRGRWECIDTG